MAKIVFTSEKVISEFWISFLDSNNVETGIIVKKLSNGSYLIPSGIKKKIFVLEEIVHIKTNVHNFVSLPFVVGSTDYPATDAMKTDTFALFVKAFKQAFCLSEEKK